MKLFKTTLIIFLISFYAFAQTNHLSTDKIKSIDNIFKKWNNQNSPGAVLSIIQDGQTLFSKGYGLANLEHNIPNSPETVFNIASNSKQFTAASIIILHQQGKLDLNQSLYSIFPDLPEYTKAISIKHLLNHTSGLRDYAQIAYLTGLRPNDYYNDDNILKWIKSQQELNFSPGEKYMYCNSGYWLLGQIVKKISGKSLGEFAKQEIFTPLKMNNTRFMDNNNMLIPKRASGYATRSGSYLNLITTQEQIGDGGVYTSVEDMKRWDDEFYNQKTLNNSFWKLMTTKGILNDGTTIKYASGLEIEAYKGLKTIDHGGREPGYWSNSIRFPEQKFTVIVFTNVSNANATPLAYKVADLFLKDKFDEQIATKEPKKENKFIKLSNTTLKKYEASYWNADEKESRSIYLKNDTLRFVRSPRSIPALAPISKNKFKVLGTPPFIEAFVTFQNSNSGYQLCTIINGKESSPYNTYIPKVYTTKDLNPFIGKYYSKEIDTYYIFKLEDDKIRLFINGRKTVALRRVKDEFFTSPMCDFQFKKSNQQINEFTLSTPRVKNLKFKRIKELL